MPIGILKDLRLYFISLISLFVIGCAAVILPEPGSMPVLLPAIDPQATARPTVQVPHIAGSNPHGEVEESPRYGLALGFDAISPIHEPYGLVLRQVPSLTAFDWAWSDFYPHSGFYEPD